MLVKDHFSVGERLTVFLGTHHQARSAADWAMITSNIEAVTPRSQTETVMLDGLEETWKGR